jgi:hypothetical protein
MKYIKLFEEHEEDPTDQETIDQMQGYGLLGPTYTYDLIFSIDYDWAMVNGPAETEKEITDLFNEIGKISMIDVNGQFGSKGISWEGPLVDVSDNDESDEYDEDEIDTYVFDSDAFITFTSKLTEPEIEDFINDNLIHVTAYGTYDLELVEENY